MTRETWQCVLELNNDRSIRSGSEEALAEAVGRGADLRVQTEFRHNEHIDTSSSSPELIREVMKFHVTYLVDRRWSAGVCTLRQPVALPGSFGPRASLSLFLYNQNGQQAVARPFLDSPPPLDAPRGPSPADAFCDMPRMHQHDSFDAQTNAPSYNFIYDFDFYRFYVRDRWRQVLENSPDGNVISGSVDELVDAFSRGMDVKVAVHGVCDDLTPPGERPIAHQVFVQTVACYYYTEQKLFIAATEPLARVRPAIPLAYRSGGWDYGWLIVRSDGYVARMLYDPYTLRPTRSETRCGMTWFAG